MNTETPYTGEESLESTKEAAGRFAREGRDRASRMLREGKEQAERYPLAVALGAVAVGAVVGVLLMRRSDEPEDKNEAVRAWLNHRYDELAESVPQTKKEYVDRPLKRGMKILRDATQNGAKASALSALFHR